MGCYEWFAGLQQVKLHTFRIRLLPTQFDDLSRVDAKHMICECMIRTAQRFQHQSQTCNKYIAATCNNSGKDSSLQHFQLMFGTSFYMCLQL